MRKDELDTQTWSDALKMYEWLCTFVGVARRAHEEWWFDVGSIMRLETRDPRDPRGWESIDRYRGEVKRLDNPLYLWWDTPSTPADVERYSGRVGELPGNRCGRCLFCSESQQVAWTSSELLGGRSTGHRGSAGLKWSFRVSLSTSAFTPTSAGKATFPTSNDSRPEATPPSADMTGTPV